jgi:hypothetical protein
MSATHYASLKRWDELFVLLTRRPDLVDELDLWATCQEKGAPTRITNLIPQGSRRPKSIKTWLDREIILDQCGNLVLDGKRFVYEDTEEGIIKRDKHYNPKLEDV